MDIRFHSIGLLVSISPLNDRAKRFIRTLSFPDGICRNIDGGGMISREDFVDVLVKFADAGLEAGPRVLAAA